MEPKTAVEIERLSKMISKLRQLRIDKRQIESALKGHNGHGGKVILEALSDTMSSAYPQRTLLAIIDFENCEELEGIFVGIIHRKILGLEIELIKDGVDTTF